MPVRVWLFLWISLHFSLSLSQHSVSCFHSVQMFAINPFAHFSIQQCNAFGEQIVWFLYNFAAKMEMEWQLDLGNIFVSHKKLLFCVQTRVFLFSPQNYIITYKLRITVAGDNLLLNMTAQFIGWRYIGATRREKKHSHCNVLHCTIFWHHFFRSFFKRINVSHAVSHKWKWFKFSQLLNILNQRMQTHNNWSVISMLVRCDKFDINSWCDKSAWIKEKEGEDMN